CRGNQLTVTDATGTTTRTYDELGRVTTKKVPVIGTVKYTYDLTTGFGMPAGCKAEITEDPRGNKTVKIFDKAGRIKEVKAGLDADSVVYHYNDNGSVASVVYPGGAREDYQYNADNTLALLTNKKADSTLLESYSYTYDRARRLISKTDRKGVTTYTYDELGRLKTVTEPGNKVTTYTYDAAGNRETELLTVNGKIVTLPYELNDSKYTYDEKNQLSKALVDGQETTYLYNAEGLRVAKAVNGKITTRYLYEYDKVVLETDGDGNEIARNIYGINLLARELRNQSVRETVYFMYNGHADVTALLDMTGKVIDTYYYDAFGNITESSGSTSNPYRYAGYQYDAETGLYYLNARMYDPKIARFLQEDTYRGDPNDVLSLNLYTYCANNPLIYYDPSGHAPKWLENLYNKASNEVQYVTNVVSNEAKYAGKVISNEARYVGGVISNEVKYAKKVISNEAKYAASVISNETKYVSGQAKNWVSEKADYVKDWYVENRVGDYIYTGVEIVGGTATTVVSGLGIYFTGGTGGGIAWVSLAHGINSMSNGIRDINNIRSGNFDKVGQNDFLRDYGYKNIGKGIGYTAGLVADGANLLKDKKTNYRESFGEAGQTVGGFAYYGVDIFGGAAGVKNSVKTLVSTSTYKSLRTTYESGNWLDGFKRMSDLKMAVPAPSTAAKTYAAFSTYIDASSIYYDGHDLYTEMRDKIGVRTNVQK
ncbi:MAG: hypothetical protein PHI24_14430, partial [Desulfitobacteriaceae bacterium]|nr:hypothetical protein [Desulfitobacteriaceae bacterium]